MNEPTASNAPVAAPSAAPSTQTQQTSQVDTPWYTGFYNDKGEINSGAYEKLPEELKPYKDTFSQSKSINGLLMQMANLASLAGKKGLAPLPEGASEQARNERAALMRQINSVPEKPELYGVKRPDDYPEQMWDDAHANDMLSLLHKHHASPALVKELFGKETEYGKSIMQRKQAEDEGAEQKYQEEQIAALKETWKNPEEYARMTDLAARAIRTAGLDPGDPMFNNASAIKMAAHFGSKISEDKLVASDTSVQQGSANNLNRALDIINNKDNPMFAAYHDNTHALHRQAYEAVETFFKAHRSK